MRTNVNARVVTAVRVELARRDLKAQALVEILGVTKAAISYRMNGHTPFSLEDLAAIATAWGIPIAQLLDEPVAAASAA